MLKQNEVTVIMPVFNEEQNIAAAVHSIVNQDFTGAIEMVIVDGNSTDHTVALIKELSRKMPANRSIKLLTNPRRFIPIGLNIACQNASHDIIVRLDGHTQAPSNYVSESLKALKEINYQGVSGGRCAIHASDSTGMSEAIAIAVSHPLGVGNAAYRTMKKELDTLLDVDTVPFGAFTKKLWQSLGGYDEELIFDEDYDFNYRVRAKGYRIVMNSKIVLKYFARKDLTALWTQYYRYGYWANKFCLKHKNIPSLRRFIPAAFVLTVILFAISSLKALAALLTVYFGTIIVLSGYEGLVKRKSFPLALCLIPVFPTLHSSYGLGSIMSILTWLKAKVLKS
ncbi:MAG: glycosyltransferase family 2 protein [Desulfosporosinus sp.]|jgi:glycosyltransferase involved in cell wall biosynthesis